MNDFNPFVKRVIQMSSMSKKDRPSFRFDTDLISLRTLVAVFDEGSFSAAGIRVGRTQSAVSLQIAKLEDRLQTRLFDRTSRSVKPTPAGETLIAYARQILGLADEAALAVSAPDEPNPLRVGFAEYLVPQHLHTLLARFRRAHPNCDLSLVLGSGAGLLDSLENGNLDLVFAGPEADWGDELWQEQLVWTGTPNLTKSRDEPVELVLMHPPCSYRQIAFDVLSRNDTRWKISIDANSVHAVQSAIRAGLGISVLPRSAVLDDMMILTDMMPALPNTSVASFISKGDPHPLANRFIDYLVSGIETTGISKTAA